MHMHPRERKGLLLDDGWRGEIERLLELSGGLNQAVLEGLDSRVKQEDVSRWRRGNYSKPPSEEKRAGIRSIVAKLEQIQFSDYDRGVLAALARAEQVVASIEGLLPPQLLVTLEDAGNEALAGGRRVLSDPGRRRQKLGGQGDPPPSA